MVADGLRVSELLILAMAGEAESIINIRFDHLGLARSSMGIVAIKTGDPGLEVCALLVVDTLLVMRFGMGFWISP